MKDEPTKPSEGGEKANNEDDLTKQMASLKVEEDVKSGEESDEGNVDKEEKPEEEVIESVCTENEEPDDDGTGYAAKGPIQQRRVLHSVRANPYGNDMNLNIVMSGEERIRQKMAAVTVSDTSSLNLMQQQHQPKIVSPATTGGANTGQFMDDPNVLANILIVGSQAGSPDGSDVKEKTGIPALPDISSMTKNSAGGPRIIVRGTPNPDGTCNAVVLPTPMAPTVDPQLRKIGIWLPRQGLPAQAMPLIVDDKIEILIQLDVKVPRVIRYLAMIGRVTDKLGQPAAVILNQFVELRPFASVNGEQIGVEGLLENVEETDIESALNLVNGKDLTDLLKTYGPNEDSMLMTLCCKKDESPTIRAQVFALVSRILGQRDPTMRANVVQKNACHLSALDYTTVTNNRRIACFLAELYYVMGENVACPDNSGNTLMHMMARKGDVSAQTLQALLGLRFSHDVNRKVYTSNLHNNKQYLPIHHAAMSRRCPQIVIQMLQRDMPSCLMARTDDGSAPIHLACQYTTDPTMIATLLYYNRDVVNLSRQDGFTPLHLVAARNDAIDRQIGLIPLEEEIQVRMIRLLLDHGADRGIKVEQRYMPFDLVKIERDRARGLLKLRRGDGTSGGNRRASPSTGKSNSAASPGVCSSPSFQASPSAVSPSFNNVLGGYDPFIGGGYNDNFSAGGDSPQCNNFGYLGSVTSDSLSDGGSNSDSGGEGTDNLLSNNLGDPVDLLGESAESELDLIAKAFYNHPTIQAVMNGTEGGTPQNNL